MTGAQQECVGVSECKINGFPGKEMNPKATTKNRRESGASTSGKTLKNNSNGATDPRTPHKRKLLSWVIFGGGSFFVLFLKA